MIGDILRKAVKDVACEEWGWVSGRVVIFCNIDVTKVTEFSNGVRMRIIGLVTVDEDVIDRNMMTNEMTKSLSKSIYIDHNIVTSVNDSEMIT